MNVAIVTYSLNYGGVSTFILTLAKAFSAKGDTVTIITTESKGIWFEKMQIPNVTYQYISGLSSWVVPMFFYIHKIAGVFKKQQYDLILVNNAPQVLAALSVLSEKPVVISVIHNDHPVLCKNACVNEAMIDSIVAVSPAVYNRAANIVKDRSKLVQVLNAIEPETEERFLSRQQYKPGESMKIIFIGRLVDEQKGVFLIPEIAAALKQKNVSFHIELAGEGSDYEKLQQQIKKLHVEDEVTLLGYVSHSDIKDKLLQSHVLLVPSYFEGLPLNVLEAMTSGCVPVMSDILNITDICFKNEVEGIACKMGESNSFVQAIDAVYTGNIDWKLLSDNARKKADIAFSSKRMFEEYVSLYERAEIKKDYIPSAIPVTLFDLLPKNILNTYIKIKKSFKK